MKSGKIFFIAILFALTATAFASEPAAYHGRGSFGVFYNHLNSYGSWMQMNDGLVVWRPRVNHRWTPYTYGNWIWTDCGWYWNSDEAFGDVVYHYGRWYYDDYYGWMWVPDYEWGPAWVDWRYDDNYIGWTPLPPYANFSINIGISFSESFSFGYSRWHFVRYGDFCHPQIGRYFVPGREKARFFDRMHSEHNYGYENGRVINRNIPRNMFESRSNIRVTENRINFRDSEGMDRSQVRGNERRIDVAIPRANTTRVDVNTLSISRADRSSSIRADRVQIGERVRNSNATPQTDRNNTTIQRNNQNSGERQNNNNTTIQRNNQNNGQREGTNRTTVTPNTNKNNNSTVTPNRSNDNPGRNKNTEIRQNQNRQNSERVNREVKRSDSQEKRESQQRGGDTNRESRSRTR